MAQAKTKKHFQVYLGGISLVITGLLSIYSVAWALSDDEFEQIVQEEIEKASDIKKINENISNKTFKIEELTKQLYVYEKNIKEKQEEKLTLQSQLDILDYDIEETKTNIEKLGLEIEVLQSEIEITQEQIDKTKAQIDDQKTNLGLIIREIYAFDQKTPIEITFSQANFAAYFADVEYANRLQANAQEILDDIKVAKKNLEQRRTEFNAKKAEIAKQKTELEVKQENLHGEEEYKQQLLDETQLSEEKFQLLVDKVKKEQSQIEASIATLEKSAQQKIIDIRDQLLNKLQSEDKAEEDLTAVEQEIVNGEINFIWPIASRTVTCGFRCDGYPFQRWFEHSGTDIATPMGTDVQAAASGYVAIAKSDGTSNYAYVMIVHGDGLSSVYGHLSNVNVEVDQYVFRGQVIGQTGGLPGTPGAGAYSTGAHLHFEIRVDGIPTDALQYLP